jgi:ATP-dependent Clp protease, protease subunit
MKLKNRPQPKLIVNAADEKEGKPAEILVYDDIGPDWLGMIGSKTIAQALKDVGDAKDITVRINSPGGSVFEGVAIYNQLKKHNAKIHIAIDGLAASIASIIAMAGDDVEIAENAMMMIHDPWAIAFGNSAELSKLVTLLDQIKTTLVDTYASKTAGKTSAEELSTLMTDETWFTAKEALEKGLVDKIDPNKKAVEAHVDNSVHNFKHVPEQFTREISPESRVESPEPQQPTGRDLVTKYRELAARAT